MNEVVKLCTDLGVSIDAAKEDRGVLVLELSNQIPTTDALDRLSDALRELGFRFVSIEFPEVR